PEQPGGRHRQGAEVHRVRRTQVGHRDAVRGSVYGGSVARAEILQHRSFANDGDPRVMTGHERVAEHHRVVLAATDPDDPGKEAGAPRLRFDDRGGWRGGFTLHGSSGSGPP
ncbi:hypothetical protein RZS08_00460, partial [Arthrospira platensis SPKY1]|nr:hypothetical protein [Arthrospira platensis SPKY1]